jgi:ABC-2 type transport system ATP-binding protein
VTEIIRVEGLRKTYASVEAVRDVSFHVNEGEVFAFLGPNGAGKTSIVEILEGYRARSAGSVSVLGQDPESGSRTFRERIGIVLQESGLPPDSRVEELLGLYRSFYPDPWDIDQALSLVELENKRGAVIKTLSGGERRRLDFALALVANPDLIFLDEPTTGFDPGARRNSWETIRSLCNLGKTVFLTTHYMDEAQELADRIAIIANGQIIAEGTPQSLGGRDHAATQIRFDLPSGRDLSELPDVSPAQMETAGTDVLVFSSTPTKTLSQLTDWATALGIELENLTVSKPSLEDTYLNIVSSLNEDFEEAATTS